MGGRRALLAATLALICVSLLAPASAGAYVYWANGGCCLSTPSIGTIGRATDDGAHANESFIHPAGNSTNLQGLAVSTQDIFWVDAAAGKVGHANLDGSSPNNAFISDRYSTAGVASDSTYVFWSNANTRAIYRAARDGSSHVTFLSSVGVVTGMTDVSGVLYWANNSTHTIGSSPTGTASASTLLTVPTPAGGSTPNVLFVAVAGGYVYWTDSANNTVGRASLSNPAGTANDAFITGASGPEGIAVDASHIYWSNSGQNGTTANNNTIGRASLDGTGVIQRFITGASVPYGLAVDDLGDTSASVSCSPASVAVDAPATCMATVANVDSATPSTPSGTVSFSSDSSGSFSSGGSCSLVATSTAGVGSCNLSYTPTVLGTGTHKLSVSYGGDSAHSVSSGSVPLTVTTRSTGTSIGCSVTPVEVGQPSTCTVTVSDADAGTVSSPTGNVSFASDSGGSFSGGGSCSLTASSTVGVSSCQVSYTPSGAQTPQTLTASFPGDATHSPSSGKTTLSVGLRDSSTSLGCSPSPIEVGQLTTCTATVNDTGTGPFAAPSGSVSFTSDTAGSFSNGGSCSLGATTTAGEASCQVSYTPTAVGSGNHKLSAAYSGDGTHSISTGLSMVAVTPGMLSITTDGASSRSGAAVTPGITLSCPSGGPNCTATETATVLLGSAITPILGGGSPHQETVGQASFTIPAGSSVQANFQLTQDAMTLLSDHPRIPLQISISGQTQGQSAVSATKTIVLDGTYAGYHVTHLLVHNNGTITMAVTVGAPGELNLLATAWKDNIAPHATQARALSHHALEPADGRFVYSQQTVTATNAGTISLTLQQTKLGQELIAHPAYKPTLRLWVSYTPIYAHQVDLGYYGLHPAGGCDGCHTRVWPTTSGGVAP